MHAQTWASYSALYRFGRLSETNHTGHAVSLNYGMMADVMRVLSAGNSNY